MGGYMAKEIKKDPMHIAQGPNTFKTKVSNYRLVDVRVIKICC